MRKCTVAVLVGLVSFILFEIPGFAQEGWRGTTIRLTDREVPADRVTQLETELASLRSRFDNSGSVSSLKSFRLCCTADCEEPRTGLHGGFEAVWLKPHFSDDTAFVRSDLTNFESIPFDNQFELTPRVWLGHTWESGFGLVIDGN